jgi:prepilin-type N-terminal cleavage/methylation domain-containing protein
MKPCSERGVTLLELLVAMTLLAIALIGLAASFPLSMYGVASGGYQTSAALYGQQCLDIAKNMAWTAVTDTLLNAQCPALTGGFTRTVTVTTTGTIKTVDVVINFPLPTGINSTTLTTIISQ